MPGTKDKIPGRDSAAVQTAATTSESRTIRVRPTAYAWLMAEAQARGESMPVAVDHLIRDIEPWRFAADAQAGYARLRQDPEAWADFRAEVDGLDGTVGDGREALPWGGE